MPVHSLDKKTDTADEERSKEQENIREESRHDRWFRLQGERGRDASRGDLGRRWVGPGWMGFLPPSLVWGYT